MSTDSIFQQSFEKTAAERDALKVEELYVINLDIPTAYATVIGSLPEIRAVRAEIAEAISKFDVTSIDALEDYAGAMMRAHNVFSTEAAPIAGLPGRRW